MNKGGLLEYFLKTYTDVWHVEKEITDSCQLVHKILLGVLSVIGIIFVLSTLGIVLSSTLVVLIGIATPFINLALISEGALIAGLCGISFMVVTIFVFLFPVVFSCVSKNNNANAVLRHFKESFIDKFCTKIEWKDK